jgi:hypothetical protein
MRGAECVSRNDCESEPRILRLSRREGKRRRRRFRRKVAKNADIFNNSPWGAHSSGLAVGGQPVAESEGDAIDG